MSQRKQKRNAKRARSQRRQRGSALILTVVVIMVLSVLGMSMVAFSTTEEKSATVYRDTLQTRALAEAGVRLVLMMFSNPTDRSIVPLYKNTGSAGAGWDYYGTTDGNIETSLNAIGISRSQRSPKLPARYTGGGNLFFRGPFSGDWGSAFGGTYAAGGGVYDLRFNCTSPAVVASNVCWLDKWINTPLLVTASDWNLNSGKITDISFYGPPSINGASYGICTVRVTAEKYNGTELLARETIEAVIGDRTQRPAVMGNGNVTFTVDLCGDGCEQIHANGTLAVNDAPAGAGEEPIGTATGAVNGDSSDPGSAAAFIAPPKINPWDLAYKPTTAAGLDKYYLVASRQLDAIWTDNDTTNNISNLQTGTAAEPCGAGLLALCQDYNLEYDRGAAGSPGTARAPKTARTAAMTPYMYKWDAVNNEWDQCDSGTSGLGDNCSSGDAPVFSVSRLDDLDDPDGTDDASPVKVDDADIPFNRTKIPQTQFTLQTTQNGATILVDGKLYAQHINTKMSLISVGTLSMHSSNTLGPALQNRVMIISGRDFYCHSNGLAPSNTCATNLTTPDYAGVIAVHEQYKTHSQHPELGLLIAEHRINLDPMVDDDATAIFNDNGDHGSICGQPDWPWALPTKPIIFSMKSATN